MASRMLHYIISIEIAKRIKIDELDRFVIGALIPDASSHNDGSYDVAHYFDVRKIDENISKGINWTRFEKKYEKQIDEDSLYIGYLCHLITDAVWFKRITDKHIRKYPKTDRGIYIQKGYKDFQILNSLLTEKYSICYPPLKISQIDIDEIDGSLVESVFSEFKNDFSQECVFDKNDLLVYPYDDVIAFVEECVECCVLEISALKNGNEKVEPYSYYTEPRP